MPRKKEDLAEIVGSLLTLIEASQWIDQHKDEFSLLKAPNKDTLKKACHDNRLTAVLKGGLYLTRETEIRTYLKNFDPKNKTESRPLKPRAQKKREQQAAAKAQAESEATKAKPKAKRSTKTKAAKLST
jgi:hypothetical protein